jgi:hypothetical protein
MQESKHNGNQHHVTLHGICFVNITGIIHFGTEGAYQWTTEIMQE